MEILTKYFSCCLSCCKQEKRKTRKELRDEWKERQKLLQPDTKELDSPKIQPKPSDEGTDPSGFPLEKIGNVVKLQSVVRGFIGRTRALRRWLELMEEANQYWMYLQWLKDEEERIRQIKERARKEFVFQYTNDVFETALLFLNQLSEASSTIQRIWRGYRARKNLPKRPPPKKKPLKVPKRKRFTAETLRRVWARSQFEPSGSGYLHSTDFGYLEYDLWEHMDNPPSEYEIGLKNRKVKLPIRKDAQEIILLHDRHAWVGLPIGFETAKEKDEWSLAKRPNNVKNMILHSPYKQPLLTDEQRRELFSPKKAPKTAAIPSTDYFFDHKDIEQLQYLKSVGYKEDYEKVYRLPGMPRIGAKEYDSMTGRLLVYRGNGKWKRIMTDEFVNYGRKYHDMKENLPISTLQSIANESSSVIVAPNLQEESTGALHITNPNYYPSQSSLSGLNNQSRFLQRHQQQYQDMFQTGPQHSSFTENTFTSSPFSPNNPKTGRAITTSQIVDSFLTNIEDIENHHNDATKVYEKPGDIYDPLLSKPLDYNPKTGTPFRGTQKIPYLALQFRAQQQMALEEEYPEKRKRRKDPTKSKDHATRAWSVAKAAADSVHNEVILKNPALSKQLIDLLYSDQVNNNDLMNTLLTEQRDLLEEHTKQYQLPSTTDPINTSNMMNDYDDYYDNNDSDSDDDIMSMKSLWRRSVSKKSQQFYNQKFLGGKMSLSQRRKIPLRYYLKYTWIPQPLIHNAVHEVFYDRSHQDLRNETKELYSERDLTEKQQQRQMRDQMINIVSPPPPIRESTMMKESDLQSLAEESMMSSLHSLSSESLEEGGSFYDPETRSVVMRSRTKQPKKVMHPSDVIREEKSEEEFDDEYDRLNHESTSLFTREGGVGSPSSQMIYEMPSSTTAISLRHNLSSNSISFPDFMQTVKANPRTLTKGRFVLESSTDTVTYNKQKKNRKFQYRPIIRKKESKVNPIHTYDWY